MSADELSQEVTPAVINELKQAIGADNVATSDLEKVSYSHDLAPLPNVTAIAFKNMPDAVCRPTSTEDVQKIVQIANKNNIPITPRGNATWGLGGAMPSFGGIVVDVTAKMSSIIEIDKENLFVKCYAGATWKEVYDACMKEGLLLGCYPTSFPSATIGGWIGTSGIGIGGYKYGSAKDNLRNLEVVMPNGKIVNTGYDTVVENMTGYNLTQLITGAEGTLGIVCKVTLKVHPAPEVMKPVAYAYDEFQDLGAPMLDITRSRVRPLHIGYLDRNHYKMQKQIGMHVPEVGGLLWMMLEGDADIVALEEAKLDAICVEKHGGKKVSDEIAEHEWSERCYEFRIREVGIGSIPGEVVVQVPNFSEFATKAYDLLDELKMEGAQIGMVADRNTVMFMPYFTMDAESLTAMTSYAFNMTLADEASKLGGHGMGFGIFFAAFLDQMKGDGADVMRDVKTAIDPKNIMNPGKLVAAKTRFGMKLSEGLMEFGKNIMVIGKKVLPESKVFEKNLKPFELEAEDRHKGEYHTK